MERRVFLNGLAGITLAPLHPFGLAAADEVRLGHLEGKFTYDGDPPLPRKLAVTKDAAILKEPLYDESLLVSKHDRGLANVVIMLQATKPDELPPVHPSFESTMKESVEMQLKGLRFVPHVCVVQTGETFVMNIADAVGHNPTYALDKNREFQPVLGKVREEKVFSKLEPEPCRVECAVHPWESAVLVVTDHPYVGVSQSNGSFIIHNLPVGKWQVQFWHERCRWIRQVTIAGKAQELEEGKLAVEIKPGKNDLGEIKIGPKLLERNGD